MATTTDWVTLDQMMEYLGSDAPDDTTGEARLANAISSASESLYALSGRKFPGILQATVRPTARMEQVPYPERRPGQIGSLSWPNQTWGWCYGGLHLTCSNPTSIGLGRGPIISVEEVVLHEEILDPINYRVEDQKWLVRSDCSGWPTCGCESCHDPFMVSFTFGEEPPQLGIDAATILSAELYRANTPNQVCKLPVRLTSITRQGVTMAVIDSMDFFKNGLTGNYQVDLFIKTFNPAQQIRKPIAFSPDMINTGRRTTWPTS
jgi:hypothetical protein